jgi:hypothetical protein
MEPYASIDARDRVWVQHAFGWRGRLGYVLGSLAGENERMPHAPTFLMEQVRFRLLGAHLALRAYQLEQGGLPSDWNEVQRAGLPALAQDAFDPGGQPLRFRRTADGFLLYSVGGDGVDNGGTPRREEGWWTEVRGDLRLDVEFAV